MLLVATTFTVCHRDLLTSNTFCNPVSYSAQNSNTQHNLNCRILFMIKKCSYTMVNDSTITITFDKTRHSQRQVQVQAYILFLNGTFSSLRHTVKNYHSMIQQQQKFSYNCCA